MAEFCEGCPIKGDCTQDIAAVYTLVSQTEAVVSEDCTTLRLSFVDGQPVGPTTTQARYVDNGGQLSRLVEVDGDSAAEAKDKAVRFLEAVAVCEGPQTKTFLGFVLKRACGAAVE